MESRGTNETPGHAFISYVREDKARVDRLQRILEAAGISVWRDTAKLWPGQDWKLEIRRAIEANSLVFISCFSEHSQRRSTSYQNEELVLAVEQIRLRAPGQGWLIPVRFSNCDLPHYELGAGRTLDSIQRVDLFRGKWEQGTVRLIVAILGILGATYEPQERAPYRPPQERPENPMSPWHFQDAESITVACGELPSHRRLPFADKNHPDHAEVYRYADLGSLFELYGYLRSENPSSRVDIVLPEEVTSTGYAAQLICLGGVYFNAATLAIMEQLQIPIRHITEWGPENEDYFEVQEGGNQRYYPLFDEHYDGKIIREDVGLLVRAVNPFNQNHTVTICTGIHAGGTYGVVRALTDPAFRTRNAEYLVNRFGDSRSYCILARVRIQSGMSLTPDWTLAESVLYEWEEGHNVP